MTGADQPSLDQPAIDPRMGTGMVVPKGLSITRIGSTTILKWRRLSPVHLLVLAPVAVWWMLMIRVLGSSARSLTSIPFLVGLAVTWYALRLVFNRSVVSIGPSGVSSQTRPIPPHNKTELRFAGVKRFSVVEQKHSSLAAINQTSSLGAGQSDGYQIIASRHGQSETVAVVSNVPSWSKASFLCTQLDGALIAHNRR